MAPAQLLLHLGKLRHNSRRSLFSIVFTLFALLPFHAIGQNAGAAQAAWNTYLGGLTDDQVLSMAVDSFGNVYVAGRTTGGLLLGNDTTGNSGLTHQNVFGGGASDAFLAKIAPQGSMLWCTYFGGTGDDEAVRVVVSNETNILLIGNTNSVDGIATDTLSLQNVPGGGNDLFLAHFTEAGLLVGATYFGGTDDEFASGAVQDALGRILICGSSNGPNTFTGGGSPVQTYIAGTDGLLICFQSTDSLVGGTYIGGEGNDSLVQVLSGDSSGFHFLGNTTSTTGIATPGAWLSDAQGGMDAFVMKADTSFTVISGTYFGGTADDRAYGLVQQGNEIVLCGRSFSDSLYTDTTAFQSVNSGGGDGFLAMLDSSLALTWSTFVGDTGYDALTAVELDQSGTLYGVGITRSALNIATANGGDLILDGTSDAFAMRIDTNRAVAWSRYFGAMGEEEAHAFCIAGNTSLFIGGRTTSESDFAVLGHQMQFGGGTWDGFAMRLDQEESTECNGICTGSSGSAGCTNYNGVTPPLNEFHLCLGDSITFIVHGGALGIEAAWMWYKDECGIPEHFLTSGDTITIAPTASFNLSVRAESLTNVTSCKYLPIIVHTFPDPIVSVSDTACMGAPVLLVGTGADSFSWVLGDTLVTGANTTASAPLVPGTHIVEITATNGPSCSVTRTDTLIVLPAPAPIWNVTDITCAGGSDGIIVLDSTSSPALEITWGTPGLEGPWLLGLVSGSYISTATDNFGCTKVDTLIVIMPPPLIDSLSTTDALCGEPTGSVTIHGTSTSAGLALLLNGDSIGTSFVEGLAPAYYTILATDSAGCHAQQSFYIEAFGNISVHINGDTVLANNGTTQLFCGTIPFDSLATFLWTPASGLDDPTSNNPICTVLDTTIYVVYATSFAGCMAQAPVVVIPRTEVPTIVLDPCGEAFLPNIFSPNNDGLNDALCVLGGCFTRISLSIYDRWGQRVFQSYSADTCWDGTHGNSPMPSGAYAFTLSGERNNGEVLERTGTLTLKR